ncbi:O-antigen ligase [Tritonibacter horizontis]|uniref:O-antigen ligase n=1 Tax=Tritonibacter horizontis TaxID=1768241 RepID=A0A132C0C0_9RHOB|nr:O-antigen ligase [Tritonibacter horizontis]
MIETFYTRARDVVGWHALAWRFYLLALATSFLVMIEPALTDLLFLLGVPILGLAGLKPVRLVGGIETLGIILFVWFSFLSLTMVEQYFLVSVRAVIIEIYMLLIFLVTAYWARHYGDHAFRAVVLMLIFGGLCTSLIGILAWLDVLPNSEIFFRDEYRSRIRSTFKDPNVLGPYLIMPLLGALWALIEDARKRLFFLPIAGILMVGLLLTFSRGAWIHGIVTIFIFFLALLNYRKTAYQVFLAGCLVLGCATFVLFIFADDIFGALSGSYFSKRVSLQSYDSERFNHIFESLFHILDHPFGVGPNQVVFKFGIEPHNTFVVFAVNNGILACFGFVIIYFAAAYRCLVKTFEGKDGWLKYAFILAIMAGLFILMNVVGGIHWRHLFVTIGLAYGNYTQNTFLDLKTSESPPSRPSL